MKRKGKLIGIGLIVAVALVVGYMKGIRDGSVGKQFHLTDEVQAAGGKVTDPTGKAPDRYVYYPGTESLAKDEIRVIACGTGMPAASGSRVADTSSTA